jgi:aspartate-semialdehyde dehydrogenase
MSRIAIVGATGLVGQEILSILEERKFKIKELLLFASEKSKNKTVKFKNTVVKIIPLSEFNNLKNKKFDFAFFSAGGKISQKWVPKFTKYSSLVIDNTNTFRMDPNVPLIVPEINPEMISLAKRNIIANPNCSTIELVMALYTLDKEATIKRVVVSTYQSVSGAGKSAIDELSEQSLNILNSKKITKKVFPHQIAFNCIPHIDVFEKNSYTKEEMKMILETSKIMGKKINLTATCVRVPVFFSHSLSVNIEFKNAISPKKAKLTLEKAPNVKVIDNIRENSYPLAINASRKNLTFVGRIREDKSVKHGLNLWIVSDNLRKGAALNAVQIAELFIHK